MLLSSMFVLAACDNDAHKDENGFTISMNIPNDDTSGDVSLWIYKADGALVDEYSYASVNELAQQRYVLPTGNYVLIAANNLVEPFSAEKMTANGIKPYEGLLFKLNNASASPTHAHYGVQNVAVDAAKASRVDVKMNRILAEVQFTIKGVPAEVTKVDAKITNAATSFLPYSGQLLPAIEVVDLGSVTPQNGYVVFPLKRVMPVIDMYARTVSAAFTRFAFIFHYTDGSTIELTAISPAIESGGSYTPEVVYDIFRPGIEITISTINGWEEGKITEGEILNPME